MDFASHAVCGTSLQDAGSLFGSKEALVAEHVNEIGQPLTAYFRNHLVDNQVYIVGLPTLIVPSHGMGTQECALHTERCCLLDTTDDTQHLQFVGSVQSIATLDLNGSGTFANDFPHPMHGLFVEFVFTHLVQAIG